MSLAENLRLEQEMSIIRDPSDQTLQMSVNADGSINVSSVQKNAELTNISRNTIVPISTPYTSTSADVSAYASVIVACRTDQDGTLTIQFSVDNTNWDSALSYSVTASTNEVRRIVVTRKYVRVVYTNTSAVEQTYFRLQAIGGNHSAITSPLNSTVQSDADATLVRPLDFNLMVSEGLYQNRSVTVKDGLNNDVDTGSVPEDINNQGGAYAGFPTGSPQTGQVIVAGADTGTVYYAYLASSTDTDYTFSSVAVTGAGTYTLSHNIWRCNFAYFVSSSPTAANAGDITIRNTPTTTNVFCVIPAGYGQAFCSAYTVPYGSSVYIDRITANMRGSSTGSMDGVFWYRGWNESPRYRFPFELTYGALYFDDIDYLIKIPERTDICPRIIYASANNLSVKVSYRLLKVKG